MHHTFMQRFEMELFMNITQEEFWMLKIWDLENIVNSLQRYSYLDFYFFCFVFLKKKIDFKSEQELCNLHKQRSEVLNEKEDCFYILQRWMRRIPAQYTDPKKQQRFTELNFNSIKTLVRNWKWDEIFLFINDVKSILFFIDCRGWIGNEKLSITNCMFTQWFVKWKYHFNRQGN